MHNPLDLLDRPLKAAGVLACAVHYAGAARPSDSLFIDLAGRALYPAGLTARRARRINITAGAIRSIDPSDPLAISRFALKLRQAGFKNIL